MRKSATIITAGLGVCLALAGVDVSPAAPMHAPKTGAMGANLVTQGKALAATDRCNTCHGAAYAGKQGFSPSLHPSGVLREYNVKTWDRVLDVGITNDGGHVKSPMPVYHLKAAQSNALYAYFKTLK